MILGRWIGGSTWYQEGIIPSLHTFLVTEDPYVSSWGSHTPRWLLLLGEGGVEEQKFLQRYNKKGWPSSLNMIMG